MEPFIDSKGCFKFREFMHQLLVDLNVAVQNIFKRGANPSRLKQVTSTEAYNANYCKNCVRARGSEFEFPGQCSTCAVTVSQTKEWIYLYIL